MTHLIYIILPVHNRLPHTQQFISCLQLQTHQNYHLVLIDDGSRDGTANIARNTLPTTALTVIQGSGHWWWAGCLQQGIDSLKVRAPAPSDVVLIINDDVTFDSEYLANALEVLTHTEARLLLSQLKDPTTGMINESGVEADLQNLTFRIAASPDSINCLSTRGLFIRWGDLQKLGNFHPRLLPHYLSDYEFTMRACKHQLRLFTCPDVWVTPDKDATGIHKIEGFRGFRFLKSYFSIKYANNPVYLSTFTLLAVPFRWVPINLFRIWARALITICRHLP